MSLEENKRLINEYPFLKIEGSEFTYLDDMPNGWRKAFGEELCKELKNTLTKLGILDEYEILQVKEKFGELRWYCAPCPPEINAILHKYCEQSRMTCAFCGKPAEFMSNDYLLPLCENCAWMIYTNGEWSKPFDYYFNKMGGNDE